MNKKKMIKKHMLIDLNNLSHLDIWFKYQPVPRFTWFFHSTVELSSTQSLY